MTDELLLGLGHSRIMRTALLLCLLPLVSCAVAREDNRRTLNLLDETMTPDSTGAKVALAPLALPVGVVAVALDAAVVHPVAVIDDAWGDTSELLWERGEETPLRRAVITPFMAVATPFVFVGDWAWRILTPADDRPGAR